MIKKLAALLLLSSVAHAFSPIRYVQISTNTLSQQSGAINISSASISSATITIIPSVTISSITISTASLISSATITNVTATTGTFTNMSISSMTSTLPMSARKITGLANGTLSTDAAAFGQIFYFQAPVISSTTASFSTTSNSYQTTNLPGATITPTSATSRIKITMTGTMQVNAATHACIASLFRGNTDLSTGGNGFSNLQGQAFGTFTRTPVAISFIDSPLTASATTYFVKIKNDDGATTVAFPDGNSETAVLILEEVK